MNRKQRKRIKMEQRRMKAALAKLGVTSITYEGVPIDQWNREHPGQYLGVSIQRSESGRIDTP